MRMLKSYNMLRINDCWKRARTTGIIDEHNCLESEGNYRVQGKEELVLVIIEGSE
jgi:hypothetical protein